MVAPLITITGPTACGKTSLSKILSNYFGIEFIEEEWEYNPYLEEFNQKKGSFLATESWFIERDYIRYKRAYEFIKRGSGVILDKPLFENHTYVEMSPLLAEEKLYCHELISRYVSQFQIPDLLIDISASSSLILKRILSRGREIESSLSEEWFNAFHRLHKIETFRYSTIPTIHIHADDKDFLNNNNDFYELIFDINKYLFIEKFGENKPRNV